MTQDFDPQKTTIQVDQWEKNRKRKTFFPAVGNKIVVAYIEGDNPAILAKLAEIEALSDTFKKFMWTPSAEPDCHASVDVRVIARTDVPT